MSDTLEKDASAVEDPQQISRDILDRIIESEDGEVKSASAAGSKMIRRKIREEGFCRRIIPPEAKGNEDLDRVLEHDRPVIIEDMEPLSRGAKSIPFGDAADTQFYHGNKFACVFNPITTPEFTKDINELRTQKIDLRKVITDNALNDVQVEEDGKFMAMSDEIVGAVGGVGKSGVTQNFELEGGFTRDNYVDAMTLLEDMNLNNGVVLINRKTAKQFLKFGRDEIGGDLSQEMFKNGLTALSEASVFGVKHIFTIKRNLVADNTIYIYTEPDYLGRFYTLQDLVMYVEKKKDILRFSARETISVTIANVAGLIKVKFV